MLKKGSICIDPFFLSVIFSLYLTSRFLNYSVNIGDFIMPSLDIVSTYDMQEIDNAVNIVKRDIANRYDFRGTNSSISLDKSEKKIKIESSSSMQREAIVDMLKDRSITRKVSLKTYDFKEEEKASGMSVRQYVHLKEGISKENAKTINKKIKEYKLKVQSQIQGDQIRVSGKKIDDLQDIMNRLKSEKLDVALQFINFKK
tara:strand:- start:397 stop:999 length:603 start_codon:yes stop_codon:yes gene_type:complete